MNNRRYTGVGETWVRIGLTQEQVAAGIQMEIMRKFASMWDRMPPDAALFARDVISDSSLQAEGYFEILYFSPSASPFVKEIASGYDSIECDTPPKGGTSLLAGPQSAFALLDSN